jgi:hypothetical protein
MFINNKQKASNCFVNTPSLTPKDEHNEQARDGPYGL